MAKHNLFMQRESWFLNGLNIGFLYCQNCRKNGTAQWVFDGTVNRLKENLALTHRQQMFTPLLDAGVITAKDIRYSSFPHTTCTKWDLKSGN